MFAVTLPDVGIDVALYIAAMIVALGIVVGMAVGGYFAFLLLRMALGWAREHPGQAIGTGVGAYYGGAKGAVAGNKVGRYADYAGTQTPDEWAADRGADI